MAMMTQSRQSVSYKFGPYRLLPLERLLIRNGAPVALTPKLFETLLIFVRHRGNLLTKDELMKMIWPDTTVEEGNLTQNIFMLRKILGENPKDHQYIVTVPLQGYCFVADVREFHKTNSNGRGVEAPDEPTRIPQTICAVLPFTLLNAPPGDHFQGVGMADTLITKLSGLRKLVVRPTSAVLRYAEAKEDLQVVGRQLQVGAVLDGTIQHMAGSVRVNVRLIDSNDGSTLWAAGYDEKYSNIFAVQDCIANQVVRALQIKLNLVEKQQLARSLTDDIDSYTLYIKGRYFWDTRTEPGMLKGIEYAREALAADESNAWAHVGLADCYSMLAEYLYLAPKKAFPLARTAALRALDLDPALAEAYASLAEVEFFYDWNWEQAENNYLTAISMKPNYASARHWYAWWLMSMSRFDDAQENVLEAQSIDPGCLILNTVLGLPHYYRRDYERAIRRFLSTLEMEPRFSQARYYLGQALVQAGRPDEAIAQLEKVRATEYRQQTVALLGCAYATAGKRELAQVQLHELQALAKQRYVSPYLEAILHAVLGDKEQALTQLESAYREKACWMVFLNVDPFLDSLRSEPRFITLLRRMGL
jgi:DNA-binding winged helix-turn-helix (wHTH) protein/Tfp pilus assembly protein PilF